MTLEEAPFFQTKIGNLLCVCHDTVVDAYLFPGSVQL